MPKNHFLNLSRDEKTGKLAGHFDLETTTLTVERVGHQVAMGNTATSIDRMMLDQFFRRVYSKWCPRQSENRRNLGNPIHRLSGTFHLDHQHKQSGGS